MIQKAERHIFINHKNTMNICYLSKNLYNYSNFILRQLYFNNLSNLPIEIQNILSYKFNKFKGLIEYHISEYDLISVFTQINQVDYRNLPAQTAQQTIKLLFKNWKSYYKSLFDFYKNPNKYKGLPKPPKYKKKYFITVFPGQNLRINKNGYLRFPKKTKLNLIKTKVNQNKLVQVRIIPKYGHSIIEVIYKKEVQNDEKLNKNNYLSIDLGVNNLITTSNNAGLRPFIINGKMIKATNQYFNKKNAKLKSILKKVNNSNDSKRLQRLHMKRSFRINDKFHKISRFIIEYCLENHIKNIVIGNNKNWKQNTKMGKKNNQKFVYIPYSDLIQKIQYKAKEVGINVIQHEEAYTSKCDSLSCEQICKHSEYLGKRVNRGLFQSAKNQLLNADVNGALNILRKVIGDDFIQPIEGLVFNPIKINI